MMKESAITPPPECITSNVMVAPTRTATHRDPVESVGFKQKTDPPWVVLDYRVTFILSPGCVSGGLGPKHCDEAVTTARLIISSTNITKPSRAPTRRGPAIVERCRYEDLV